MVPKFEPSAMRADLCELHGAPILADAEAAVDVFVEKYGTLYPRDFECLARNQNALLAFYYFDRALGSPAHEQSDRVHLRDGTTQDRANQGIAVAQDHTPDDIQARHGGLQDLEPSEGWELVARGHRPPVNLRHLPKGHQESSIAQPFADLREAWAQRERKAVKLASPTDNAKS